MKNTEPKPFVFVLMPFEESFNDIYQLGIKATCKDTGLYCERVDEQVFEESILERIYNQIVKADVIVADMTNRNPNVFYETGYAHALGKRVILLTQKVDDIPFDLKHYPHIVYGGKIVELKAELENKLKWYVEHPKESVSLPDFQIQIFVAGKKLQETPEFNIRPIMNNDMSLRANYALSFNLDLHNPSNKVYSSGAFKLAIITPKSIQVSRRSEKVIRLPDDNFMHVLPQVGTIFPYAWESVSIQLGTYTNDGVVSMTVRAFTEVGTHDFPFTVALGI